MPAADAEPVLLSARLGGRLAGVGLRRRQRVRGQSREAARVLRQPAMAVPDEPQTEVGPIEPLAAPRTGRECHVSTTRYVTACELVMFPGAATFVTPTVSVPDDVPTSALMATV